MKTIKLTILFSMLLTIVSCSNNAESVEVKYITEDIIKANPHNLKLNESKKWAVNTEMMVHVNAIDSKIKAFKGTTLKDYTDLGKTIHFNLRKLTKSCTMTGESHDELHKWLLPFFDLNDYLKKSATVENGEGMLEKMKYEFAVFNTYFE